MSAPPSSVANRAARSHGAPLSREGHGRQFRDLDRSCPPPAHGPMPLPTSFPSKVSCSVPATASGYAAARLRPSSICWPAPTVPPSREKVTAGSSAISTVGDGDLAFRSRHAESRRGEAVGEHRPCLARRDKLHLRRAGRCDVDSPRVGGESRRDSDRARNQSGMESDHLGLSGNDGGGCAGRNSKGDLLTAGGPPQRRIAY
jgi:hypothetical protein